MNFACSREEWMEQLRVKSLHTARDENQNYIDLRKAERSDSEAELDSGIPSIDGDTPQDVAQTRRSLEVDLFLSRQDSGASSEQSSECTENTLGLQLRFDGLATRNKQLPCKNHRRQVVANNRDDVMKNGNCFCDEDGIDNLNYQDVNKTSIRDVCCSTSKRNSFGKGCELRENNASSIITIGDYTSSRAGGNDSNAEASLMNEDNTADEQCHSKQFVNKSNEDRPEYNRRYTEVSIAEEERKGNPVSNGQNYNCLNKNAHISKHTHFLNKLTQNHERSATSEKLKITAKYQKSSAISEEERNIIWQGYASLTKSLTEIVDQLLYKDLLIAHLSSDIIDSTDDPIEDDLLEIEEAFLHDEIFLTSELLQTLEIITEQQCVEESLQAKQLQRIQRDIEDRRIFVQALERIFRNTKFKTMPKQLKRYCSVESLLSDVVVEKHSNLKTLLDEEEVLEDLV